MKLIIDIPEENYKLICSDGRSFLPSYKWIKNGIPLEQIRDEIEKLEPFDSLYDYSDVIKDVLEVIDKYR